MGRIFLFLIEKAREETGFRGKDRKLISKGDVIGQQDGGGWRMKSPSKAISRESLVSWLSH